MAKIHVDETYGNHQITIVSFLSGFVLIDRLNAGFNQLEWWGYLSTIHLFVCIEIHWL